MQEHTYLHWADRGRSGIIVYIIGFLLLISISLFFGQVFAVVGGLLIQSDTPAANIIKITFFGFIFSFFCVPLLVRLLHARPWWTVAMPEKRVEWRNFAIGFIAVLLVMVLLNGVGYLMNPSDFVYNGFEASTWMVMFFLAAIAFFVQASTEEMVYRGYVTQFVYRFSKQPVFFLLIPAIVFSLPHFGNIKVSAGVYAVLPYILMGLTFGWLAYRSGSLWMGVGAHLANNWFITLFVGSSAENIQKISLYSTVSKTVNAFDQSVSSLVYCIAVISVAEILMWLTNARSSKRVHTG